MRVDKLARQIVNNVLKHESVKNRGLNLREYDAVPRHLLWEADDEDKRLDDIEGALKASMESKHSNRETWISWIYLANLRIVRDHRRDPHRPYRAARLFNRIVNHLLVLDGAAAMIVYDVLAGKEQIRYLIIN